MPVSPIPAGYHTLTPYLTVRGADALIEFLERVFDAKVIHKMLGPTGKVGHAELQVGDSRVMLGEVCGASEPMPSTLYVYVPDADAVYKRALEAGATSIREVADQFYGDRHGGVKDACGNQWWIATHIEDVSPEELARRAAAHHGKEK
jgi:PhnB protein